MGLPAVGTAVGGVPELLKSPSDELSQKDAPKVNDDSEEKRTAETPHRPALKNTQAPEWNDIILPDGVKKTDGGILVPPGNPGALANAMGTLSRSPELRRMMARNNMARRDEFDPRRRAETVEALYIDALARRNILQTENK